VCVCVCCVCVCVCVCVCCVCVCVVCVCCVCVCVLCVCVCVCVLCVCVVCVSRRCIVSGVGVRAGTGEEEEDRRASTPPTTPAHVHARTLGPAQAGHQLGLVDDAHKLVRDQLDHLLAQQRAAPALDQVELRVDLVGAVDGQVQAGDGVQGGQGDAQLCASVACVWCFVYGGVAWSGVS
jgi:hypothetical protein